MQILPRQEPVWGQALSGLLSGLGEAGGKIGSAYYQAKTRKELEAKQKQEKATERMQLGNSFSSMLGLSPEQGMALANAPADIQKTVVQQIIERGGFRPMGMGMPQNQGMQSPLQSLQGLQEVPQQESVPMGGLSLSQAAQSIRPEDSNAFLAQRVLQGAATGQTPKAEPAVPTSRELLKSLDKEIDQSLRTYDINQGVDIQPTNISGLLASGMSKDEAKQALKDTSEYDKKLKEEAKAAKDLVRITKDMQDIVEKDIKSGGKLLRGAATQTLLESAEDWRGKAGAGTMGAALGGILGSVIPGIGTIAGSTLGGVLGAAAPTAFEAYQRGTATPETQRFEKNSAEFIKGAKGIFGSRITDADLKLFMKMVPTLSNTNEGKLAVLRNIQLVNEATLVKSKIRDKIVKANGGRRPYNLEQMVEEVAEPILDRFSTQFKDETEKLMARYSTPESSKQVENKPTKGSFGRYNPDEL